MIHPAGAPAQTELHVEQRFTRSTSAGEKFSLIRAIPRTGRTHQIRVHLARLVIRSSATKFMDRTNGFICNSSRPGGQRNSSDTYFCRGTRLHAAKLGIDGEGEWTSPLPADLADFCSGDL